tara:strand:- start:302 stop:1558 length:1257 start_codon:yes stop_codon:yes gene_type:complete
LEIAVIGSGISGLSSSLFLSKKNNVTLYEKNNYFGGHTNTKTINHQNKKINVDTGFIVFNKLNYPNLVKLFDFYNVAYEDSDMSLSVSNLNNKIEWSGQSLNTVFADRKRILDINFLKFLIDILKFNKFIKNNINELSTDKQPLGEWLKNKSFSEQFQENYILPMSAAIWSMSSNDVLNYPISNLFSFFNNHRLLHEKKVRPQWLTVSNGSKSYIDRVLKSVNINKKLNSKIQKINTNGNKFSLIDINGTQKEYDKIIFSIHPEKILEIKNDFDKKMTSILSLFKTSKNIAYLHCDTSLMPKNRKVWSSWNVFSDKEMDKVSLTYWMNKLQNIDNNYPTFVTLNPLHLPNESKIFEVIDYEHPIYNENAINGQLQLDSIQGYKNCWYCGAWTGNGFHEAGLSSSLMISERLNGVVPWH